MAFLQNFTHDVFISYAHIDNVPEQEGTLGWAEHFERRLSLKLLKQLGEPATIWRDPALDRSQVYDRVIEDAVKQSAIMICLLSPAYLKSDYCAQEIKWFCERSELETRTGHRLIFPVQLYGLPFDQWPEAFKGLSGFRFCEQDNSNIGRPLEPADDLYNDRQWELAREIETMLNALRDEQCNADDAVPAPECDADKPFRVFLGATADDLARDRLYVKKELEAQGIEVIQRMPPPWAPAEHAAAVREAVQQADLAVHLLGAYPGAAIDDENSEKSFPIEQVELALDLASSQLVLLPESFDPRGIEEHAYADFVEQLRQRPREGARFEMVKAGRAEMVQTILQRRQLYEEAAHTTTVSKDTPKTAFIDLHLNDLNQVSDLIGYLADHNISAVTMPSVNQSPIAGMEQFEHHLNTAELFIVVFGDVARDWVLHRVHEGFKLITTLGLGTRMGVYVAPPEKSSEVINFGVCDVMLNSRRFDPATVMPLLGDA